MAKSFKVAALFAAALCFSSLLCSAYATLFVEGKVYCDTCRVEFETKLSEPLAGATVQLLCKNRENSTATLLKEAVAGKDGRYSVPVEGDHEDDICEVSLVKSPVADCAEPFQKAIRTARVLLTENVGVVQPARYANSLGFKKKVAVKGCEQVLLEMGFIPIV